MSGYVHCRCRATRVLQLTAALAALALLAGCGGAPYDIVPVSGKVTYKGGEPIPGDRVVVTFHPQVEKIDAKTHPRPGMAEAGKDGTFAYVTTWKHKDGLIPGKHKVTVMSLDANENPTNAVPLKYQNPKQTPLEVEVKDSGELPPLEVDKP